MARRNSPPRGPKKPNKPSTSEPASRNRKKQFSRNSAVHKTFSDESLLLYGIHTVRAALENKSRKKITLYCSENALPRIGQDLIDAANLAVELKSSSSLDQMVGPDAVHQGAILRCQPLDALDASELFHLADAKIILMLDQITDPHNVGAILRSATALGVDAVLTTSRNSAHETAVMAKSASGALDMIKLVQLRNLSKGLAELNEMSFFSIGLDSEGPLVLEETLSESNPTKVVLVLGSEGKGLRQQTRETCSALARLDMPGPIKSLNVSNAAVLSLYAVRHHLRSASR